LAASYEYVVRAPSSIFTRRLPTLSYVNVSGVIRLMRSFAGVCESVL